MFGSTVLRHEDPKYFLSANEFIDYDHPDVTALAEELLEESSHPVDFARRAFNWVRDCIRHSYDYGDEQVSISASQTLLNRTGLCFAKTHLLTALLRSQNIPAALCYQRLTHVEGYVVHGLVAVWLQDAWSRQDPRGNTNGTKAAFHVRHEQLARPTDTSAGEVDYPRLYLTPAPEVIAALQQSPRLSQVVLPQSLVTAAPPEY